MKAQNRDWKTWLTYALWILGFAAILYGAFFHSVPVLDKPLSQEAREKGVTMQIYSEARLTSAVSTDKVVRTEEGILQTVPDTGFCAA